MLSCLHTNSHCGEKMILLSFYLHNWTFCTINEIILSYLKGPLFYISIYKFPGKNTCQSDESMPWNNWKCLPFVARKSSFLTLMTRSVKSRDEMRPLKALCVMVRTTLRSWNREHSVSTDFLMHIFTQHYWLDTLKTRIISILVPTKWLSFHQYFQINFPEWKLL